MKLVLASTKANNIYPRAWNQEYVGLPIVEEGKQHRPDVAQERLGPPKDLERFWNRGALQDVGILYSNSNIQRSKDDVSFVLTY